LAIIAAPLFRLTRKYSDYKGQLLPKDDMAAFCTLQNSLTSEPIMAFPRADHQYVLITNAATGTADPAGSLGTILTQKDKIDKYSAISYASWQLKDHEKNYSLFQLESAAAVWGMDFFNEYLKGKFFSFLRTSGINGPPPHKNNKQVASVTFRALFCHPIRKSRNNAS
jgi:hypothetical protein